MNITFSDPTINDCGRWPAAAANSSATVVIRSVPSYQFVCVDLDYIFTHPNETFVPGQSSTNASDERDGVRYSLSSPDGNTNVGWSPGRFNYSQVFYTQQHLYDDEAQDDSLVGRLMLRAYDEPGCAGNSAANNLMNDNWYSWDCTGEAGVCSNLSFSVRSILLTGPEIGKTAGESGCMNAAKLSAASGGTKTSRLVPVLVVCVVLGLPY